MNSRSIKDYETSYQHHDYEEIQAEMRREHILRFISKYKPKSILEIGCGLSPLFESIEEFDHFEIVEPGQTFHKNALELAKIHIQKDKIKVLNQYIENYKPKRSFDTIICAGLIHEVENDKLVLNSIHKISDRSTTVYLNTINAFSFHRLLGLTAGIVEDVYELSHSQKQLQQFRAYGISDLSNMIDKLGFEIIEKESIIFKPLTHSQMWSLVENNILSKSILFAMSKMVQYCPEHGSELSLVLRKK